MIEIDWDYPPIFAIDTESIINSIWLGWWLITWDKGNALKTIDISFQPGL
jgi:hypothetical protein